MNYKKITRYFIMLACVLAGCITDTPEPDSLSQETLPPSQPASLSQEAPAETERVFATPITPPLIAEFGHLHGFTGDILLGNTRFHAILAGIPLSRQKNTPYKGIIAIFRNLNGQWRRMHIVDAMIFERKSSDDLQYTPLGINIETEEAEQRGIATVIFAPAGRKEPRIQLKFHVLAQHDWIVIENTVPDNLSAKAPPYWNARWKSSFGEQLMIRETPQDSAALLRYFQDETIAYIGSLESSGQMSQFPNSTFKIMDRSQSINSLAHLLIGMPETKNLASFTTLHKKCIESFQVSGGRHARFKDMSLQAYFKCVQDRHQFTENIVIQNNQNYGSPQFLVNERSQKVNYLYIPQKSRLSLSNQNQRTLQLEHAISTRRSLPIETSPRGELRVLGDDYGRARLLSSEAVDRNGSVLMKLQSHISPNATQLILDQDNTAMKNLGINLWHFTKWPQEISLSTGFYRMEAYDMTYNVLCSAVFEVRKEHISEVVCTKQGSANPDSFAQSFDIPQLLTAFPADSYSANRMQQDGYNQNTQTLWATSQEDQLELRVYPIDEKTAGKWQNYKSDYPQDASFERLGQFAQELNTPVIKEIICPSSVTTEATFSAAIRKTKPNALQIFGCPHLDFKMAEAIEVSRATTGKLPLILPASNNNPLIPLSGITSITLPDTLNAPSLFLEQKSYRALLDNTRYNLSRGALLRVNTPATQSIRLKDGQTQEVAFDLEIKALWPYQVTGIELIYSDGMSQTRKLEIGAGEYAIAKFRSRMNTELSWVQIRLIGSIISQYAGLRELEEKDTVVASSAPIAIISDSSLNN